MSHFDRVVLVDDNEHDNFINERFIKLAGWADEVQTFTSGHEVLASVDSLTPPDVMFVDVNMPGMTGFELLDALASSSLDLSATKVVVLTSSVHPDDKQRAEGIYSVSSYVQKPLGLDLLTRLAAELTA
jgi:CheY-like chemotaxis protein